MKNLTLTNLMKENDFYDCCFSEIDYNDVMLGEKKFENCKFNNCNFSETKFLACKFIECDFYNCNLSSAQLDNSTFVEISFIESKLIGINWTKLKWPHIKLSSPFQFIKSNISHSSFFELDLSELVIEECKAHDVDFREADLTGASFVLSDLEKSLFMHTNLYSADFTNATNYLIDPTENNIRKAKFSVPDVLNLLHNFEIEIQS